MTILVTGGAGFIGANFVRTSLDVSDETIVNLDKLTYAGNLESLQSVSQNDRHIFEKGDITDVALIDSLLRKYKPRAIVNFAAESHVDRSILGPEAFIETNIVGTFRLLEASRRYWTEMEAGKQATFRYLQVSTDEVYGSLSPNDAAFSEANKYEPNSPYSASKASSDHLVRSYQHTYGLPTLTTNCSNNYGPFQFPEKLIPLIIHNALDEKPLPIYGDGQQIRDWLYVEDHCDAIRSVLANGRVGETYNVGGESEMTNLDVVSIVCEILDRLRPRDKGKYFDLVTYVTDRPGHDRRYAVDISKIKSELGWTPAESFETGIEKTVRWYLDHQTWIEHIKSGEYLSWVEKQYG
ncbi:MAG: dTDP-glucose 4,6-dehydratase [Betaproteobacteria bacterium]